MTLEDWVAKNFQPDGRPSRAVVKPQTTEQIVEKALKESREQDAGSVLSLRDLMLDTLPAPVKSVAVSSESECKLDELNSAPFFFLF